MCKVATDNDYDDYNEYAACLAEHLWNILCEDNSYTRDDIYNCIQEFNKSLEEHG